ncbi:MAG: hypothetical protein GY765_25435 [bacterium]|nr:hypothetical protein [bacterium]
MATNKISASSERLALSAECADAVRNNLVKIIGDDTVACAGPGENAVGYLRCQDLGIDGLWTVELFYSKEMEVEFSETVVAGDYMKISDLTEGVQKFGKWVAGTDAEYLRVGVCWNGGDTTSGGSILIK